MPGAHHKYSPSSVARLVQCPGSVRMQQQYPEETSEVAGEGTMLHAILAGAEGAPARDTLTIEQQSTLERCDDYVAQVVPEGWRIEREQAVTILDYSFRQISAGTADLVAISPDGERAILIDWKFGRGDVPPPHANWQLALYAAGVNQKFGVREVTAHIFQPRAEHQSPYAYTDFDGIIERFSEAIIEAEQPSLRLNPAKAACQYCRARRDCPALRLLVQGAQVRELDEASITEAYDDAKLAEIWVDAVLKRAKELAHSSQVEGLRINERPGDRQIEDAMRAFAEVQDNLSQEEFLSVVKVPVGALEDALAKKIQANHSDLKRMTAKAAKELAGTIIARFAKRGPNKVTVERVTA